MFGLGALEIGIIAVIILFIFGAKRLPDIGEGLGKAIREFRNVKKEFPKEEGDEASGKVKDGEPPSIESKIAGKVADRVSNRIPAVKQAKRLKEGADKVKNLLS
jgi:sec-independent protein translocase protein TatA